MRSGDVLVSELRREHGELWRACGQGPHALRPSTGDPAIDGVLANPQLFKDTDAVTLDFRADDLLLLYAAPVARRTLGLPRHYSQEEAAAAVHAHRLVVGEALAGWRDWLGHDLLVYDSDDAPGQRVVIRLAYSIDALLTLPPEAVAH